jgi:hypothetical protein
MQLPPVNLGHLAGRPPAGDPRCLFKKKFFCATNELTSQNTGASSKRQLNARKGRGPTMTIECPQCQEGCQVEAASIPPEGIEITCSCCHLTFRMRPHETASAGDARAPQAFAEGPPPASRPASAGLGRAAEDGRAEFPVHIFLQKDEMPYWMVAAYPRPGGAETSLTRPDEPEQRFLSQSMHEQAGERAGDIPILIDDEIVGGEEAAVDFELPGPAAPRVRETESALPRRSRRALARVGIGVIACGFLVALVFLGRFVWNESRGALGRLAGKASAVLHSEKGDKGKLQFSNLGHEFVSRGKGEAPVFVIEGRVTNNHSESCHSIKVKGILFDERGRQAAEKTAYCGNLLKREEIQSYPPDRIEKTLQNVYGSGLSNFDVAPGGSLPFMLVFFDPPEKVSEFSVEIAGYQMKGAGGSSPQP